MPDLTALARGDASGIAAQAVPGDRYVFVFEQDSTPIGIRRERLRAP